MTKPTRDVNQGEGDVTADGRYREAARRFVASGRVGFAARAPHDAPQPEPSAAPVTDAEPLPTFWTEKQATAWDRIKEALRRDWMQTRYHLGIQGGAELRQTATDTLAQAAGISPLPNGAEVGLDWDLARHAIRLGHGSATFWVSDASWNDEVEARVRAEWSGLANGIAWEQAMPLVRYGWDQGRADVSTPPTSI
jgi:hypothetical protein